MVFINIYKLLKYFTVKRNKLVVSLKYFDENPSIYPALTLS